VLIFYSIGSDSDKEAVTERYSFYRFHDIRSKNICPTDIWKTMYKENLLTINSFSKWWGFKGIDQIVYWPNVTWARGFQPKVAKLFLMYTSS
jgi:hypothetical protein